MKTITQQRKAVAGVHSPGKNIGKTDKPLMGGVQIQAMMTVLQDPVTLYAAWHDFTGLPRFMKHLVSVTELDGQKTHWVVRAPAGRTVEWDAEIINDVPNELISWRSVEEADIQNAGSVTFRPAPEGRGTEVHVTLTYNPPGGRAGAWLAKMFGEEPELQVREDLRRFKQLMEAGEIPTNEMRPEGAEKTEGGAGASRVSGRYPR
jgi:uncharacterized membrane protein